MRKVITPAVIAGMVLATPAAAAAALVPDLNYTGRTSPTRTEQIKNLAANWWDFDVSNPTRVRVSLRYGWSHCDCLATAVVETIRNGRIRGPITVYVGQGVRGTYGPQGKYLPNRSVSVHAYVESILAPGHYRLHVDASKQAKYRLRVSSTAPLQIVPEPPRR